MLLLLHPLRLAHLLSYPPWPTLAKPSSWLTVPKYTCKSPDILKSIIAAHAKLLIFLLFFFFSKPSTKLADVGKLLWAQTSYIVFVWVQVYHWLPWKVVACKFFIDIEDLCTLLKAILHRSILSGYAYIYVHKSTIGIRSQSHAWASLLSL